MAGKSTVEGVGEGLGRVGGSTGEGHEGGEAAISVDRGGDISAQEALQRAEMISNQVRYLLPVIPLGVGRFAALRRLAASASRDVALASLITLQRPCAVLVSTYSHFLSV